MDVRRRISFNMNTGGGQPSEPSTGGTYTVNLNGQWEKTTAISNPDSTLYDGVYRSTSNYNVNSGVATMYITIKDCSSFKMYIRSYAEPCCDYVMVSQLDQTITGSTSYSNTTLVKAHTKNISQSSTALSNYTLVEFTGITSGEHTITIVYRKDSSVNSGDDRGYVLISKNNEGGSSEGPINTDNYLTILALEDGLTAKLSTNACQYCIDGDGNWIDLPANTATQAISSGQTLSFKGELSPRSGDGIGTFSISKKCNLKGNCMSLLFGDDAMNNNNLSGKDYAFYKLFYNCTTIIQVSESFLPATVMAGYCYQYMFYGCTSLTQAPELPATITADQCYYSMFHGCTSLTIGPSILPATILVGSCYAHMFYGCTSLTTAPTLPATTLYRFCYGSMFDGCTSLTTAPELPAKNLKDLCYKRMFYACTSLTTAPELPATTLTKECYYGMFHGCKSLTTAPELPATTLTDSCYYNMFYGCSNLNYIKMLATNISASNCLNYWVYGVSSTGTFVKNPAMTSLPTGNSGIPSGWTVVDDN